MKLDTITLVGDYRVAELRYITDEGGFYRECRAPGSDVSDLPEDEQKKIAVEWTPEVIAAYYEATKEVPPEPEPTDPLAAQIVTLEAAVAALKKQGILTDTMIDAERVAIEEKTK